MNIRTRMRFLNLGHFVDHYMLLIFPTAVLSIETEWNLSYGNAMALGTPMFIAFALGTLPAGWLGDRWSRHHMMTLFFAGCGLSAIITGLTSGPVGLSIGLGALGFFAAIYHPVGIAAVTEIATRRGQALAVNGVCGNMGLATAALMTGLLASQFGWRAAFILPGIVATLVGLAHFLMGPTTGKTSLAESHGVAARANQHGSAHDIWRVLIFVGLAALLGGVIFNVVSLSLPKLLDERLISNTGDVAVIGAYASLIFAVAGLAQLPVGWLLDNYDTRPLLAVLFIGKTALLYLTASTFGHAIVPTAMALVLLMFAWTPVTSWLIGHYVEPQWRSRIFSIEYTLSLGTTSLVVPAIAYLHNNSIGFDDQYLILAGFSCAIFAAIWILPARARPAATAPEIS